MATTTRAVLRQRLSEIVLDYHAGTATGGSTTTLVDTALTSLFNGGDDDAFAGWYVYVLTNANSAGNPPAGNIRRVSAYTASSGTLTVESAWSGSSSAQVSDTYELHRYNPTYKHEAINRAARKIYPDLYIARIDETILTNNLLANPTFETYTSAASTPDSWSAYGSATLSKETTRVWHGSNSVKIIASGADEGISQELFSTVNINSIEGKSLRVDGRVWASAAATARLRVSFDNGSSFTSSSYHGGDEEWSGAETLYLEAAVPAGATTMIVYAEVKNGGTAYFDNIGAYIDRVYRYTVPSTFARFPSQVELQAHRDEPLGPYIPLMNWYQERNGATFYLRFDEPLPNGHILRLEGRDYLSAVSAEADTVEVGGPEQDLIAELAAAELFRSLLSIASKEGAEEYLALARIHEIEAQKLRATAGVRMRKTARLSYRSVR